MRQLLANRSFLSRISCLIPLAVYVICGISISNGVASAQGKDSYNWNWKTCQGIYRPTLKAAGITKEEKTEIFKVESKAFLQREKSLEAKAIENFDAAQFDKKWSESPDRQRDIAEAVNDESIRFKDLDGDGIPEILLMGGTGQAGGDGNRMFRILKKENGHYKVLVDDNGGCINVDGRKDPRRPIIVLYGHYSGNDGGLSLFQFERDGTIHNIANYHVEWPIHLGGAFHGVPTLTWAATRGVHFDRLEPPVSPTP
jgi:hypothetical protein